MISTNPLINGSQQSQLITLRNPTVEANNLEQQFEIDKAARRIISTPMPDDQRRAALTDLLRQRAQLMFHYPVNGIKGSVFFLNLIQNTLPTALCPFYNKMQLPTISSYHTIGSNISSIRLDPTALNHVPKEVLEKAGDLSGKQIDLFWTAVDGRPFVGLDRPINLCTHTWSHPTALPGDNVAYDVNMGIFPEIGFERSKSSRAIAFNSLSPMRVHAHDGLYSPDNAHFSPIANSPFGVLWTVIQKDQRIAITKMLVLFDYDHPICAPIVGSIRNCDTLDTHLTRLDNTKGGIQHTLAPLIDLFERNDPRAMEEFKKLPLAFQYEIFKETWILFNSPHGIHGDFGKASFNNEPGLNNTYHCNNGQRAAAIRQFATHLQSILVDSQVDLLFNSQALVKGDNILKMMRCAQLFHNGDRDQGLALFQSFSREEQGAVFDAIWHLHKCPRGDRDFGQKTFNLANCKMQAEAVLLAASRLPHHFNQPIGKATPLSPSQMLEKLMQIIFDDQFHTLSNSEKANRVNALLSQLPLSPRSKIYGRVYENSTDPQKGGPSWGEIHVADDLDVLIFSFREAFI